MSGTIPYNEIANSQYEFFQKGFSTIPQKHLRKFDLNYWLQKIARGYCTRNTEEYLFKLIKQALLSRMDAIYDSGRKEITFTVFANMACNNSYIKYSDEKINFKSKNYFNQMNQFIAAHFFKHDVPISFYNSFYSHIFNTFDIQRMVDISNGASPRKIYGLSKNENKYFYENIDCENEHVLLAYLAARANKCNRILSYCLACVLSNKIKDKLKEQIDCEIYLMKCRHFCDFFSKQGMFDYSLINDILDYVKRTSVFIENYDFSGKNINSMLKRVESWHEELNRQRIFQKRSWDKHGFDDDFSHKYEFVELHTTQQLKEEGNHQHNCVYSYHNNCANNYCAIVSMRNKYDFSRTTIEINLRSQKIVQIREKYNKLVNNSKFDVIYQYANKHGLKCRKSDLI